MYKKVKIIIYTFGFVSISYFYFKEGFEATHTPPSAIICAVILFMVSIVWMNVDYILAHLLSVYKTSYRGHLVTLFLSLIFIISVIVLVS